MRLLTTLLLFCMSLSLHAQDVTENGQLQDALATAEDVAENLDNDNTFIH